MPYFALDTILLAGDQVEPGHEIPDTFVDTFGDEQTVDRDRLVDLGVAEKAKSPSINPDTGNGDQGDGNQGGEGDEIAAAVAELSYPQLKAELKERELPTTGKAPELAERLIEALRAEADGGQGDGNGGA